MFPSQPSAPLSVAQLNRQVKQLLETQYPMVPVKGEISTLNAPSSGHIYFTLKDAGAQLKCAMFRSQLTRNQHRPKQGDEVIVYGKLSLYEGRGDYQLIANKIEPIGEGALQGEFFALKQRLATEGLFNESHKQSLPKHIRRVGIITSSTGAAFHDILTVLNRRFPAMAVTLYPSLVQGEQANDDIVKAIETANRRDEVDVIIVGRGGGSLEDLWSFNTEAVARAIYQSRLPIISAVGHEVDFTISDFVADVRAATPSQAAEIISPDQNELAQNIDVLNLRLHQALLRTITTLKIELKKVSSRLKSPQSTLLDWQSRLNQAQRRLIYVQERDLNQHKDRLHHLNHRLNGQSPYAVLAREQSRLQQVQTRLSNAGALKIQHLSNALRLNVSKLNILSPLSTLERGYSITRDANGKVIRQSDNLNLGDTVYTLLESGSITANITNIKKPTS